jgi:hypothetical protein
MTSAALALRRRPPERTLRWAANAIGPGSTTASLRRLTPGGWHAGMVAAAQDSSRTSEGARK